MKIHSHPQSAQNGSILIGTFVFVVIIVSAIAGMCAFVAQSSSLAHRRNDMINAIQSAQGGAVIGCADLNATFLTTNKTGTISDRLAARGYTLNTSLSTSAQNVYERTISAPFTNQTVKAQILVPNPSSPISGKIVATATKNKVTQTATVNVKLAWGYPAAIISVNPGTKSTGVSKSVAQNGNVVVDGSKNGITIVDGGAGLAVMANGQVNFNTNFANISQYSVTKTNYNTANEIPDYTAQGTANALFDFNRFVAIADRTSQPTTINPNGNNHFTNMTTFVAGVNAAYLTPAKALEGVIVVDVEKGAKDLDSKFFPNGINIKGTLFFKFDSSYGPLDKIINTATMNINPADLTGLVPSKPATYPSGYPPVYYDNSKNPTNINITSKGFANVAPQEDLPALVYSIGVLDIHGSANVSGVMYTPSNMEIENKDDGQIQYFKGSLIMGLGIYFENGSKATSIISFEPKAVDSLSTLGQAGKQVVAAYWQ